jgi:hypothetical protein
VPDVSPPLPEVSPPVPVVLPPLAVPFAGVLSETGAQPQVLAQAQANSAKADVRIRPAELSMIAR